MYVHVHQLLRNVYSFRSVGVFSTVETVQTLYFLLVELIHFYSLPRSLCMDMAHSIYAFKRARYRWKACRWWHVNGIVAVWVQIFHTTFLLDYKKKKTKKCKWIYLYKLDQLYVYNGNHVFCLDIVCWNELCEKEWACDGTSESNETESIIEYSHLNSVED